MARNLVVHEASVTWPNPDEGQEQELPERPFGGSLLLRAILLLCFLTRRGPQNIALGPAGRKFKTPNMENWVHKEMNAY